MTQPWQPEQVVTEKLACELIEGQFPSLSPVALRVLGEGFDNTVYQVNEQYVFRFPRREIAVEFIKKERNLLPILVPHLPLDIPEPLFLGKSSDNYPWPFLGYRLVHGETPTQISTAQSEQAVLVLADFLKTLHRFPVQQAKACGIPPCDTLQRLDIATRKPRLQAHLEKVSELDLYPDKQTLHSYLDSLEPMEATYTESLVHGDLHIRNLLVDARGAVTGVIDWGDAHVGNPALDLAVTFSFLPPEVRPLFYKKYGAVSEETLALARFRAVFTNMVLLLYGHDQGDGQLVNLAKESLQMALR